MPFTPIDIKDQSVQYPNRFKIDGVSHTIETDFGAVTEAGTPVNKALLQRYEDTLEEHDADIIHAQNTINFNDIPYNARLFPLSAKYLTSSRTITQSHYAVSPNKLYSFSVSSNFPASYDIRMHDYGSSAVKNSYTQTNIYTTATYLQIQYADNENIVVRQSYWNSSYGTYSRLDFYSYDADGIYYHGNATIGNQVETQWRIPGGRYYDSVYNAAMCSSLIRSASYLVFGNHLYNRITHTPITAVTIPYNAPYTFCAHESEDYYYVAALNATGITVYRYSLSDSGATGGGFINYSSYDGATTNTPYICCDANYIFVYKDSKLFKFSRSTGSLVLSASCGFSYVECMTVVGSKLLVYVPTDLTIRYMRNADTFQGIANDILVSDNSARTFLTGLSVTAIQNTYNQYGILPSFGYYYITSFFTDGSFICGGTEILETRTVYAPIFTKEEE